MPSWRLGTAMAETVLTGPRSSHACPWRVIGQRAEGNAVNLETTLTIASPKGGSGEFG